MLLSQNIWPCDSFRIEQDNSKHVAGWQCQTLAVAFPHATISSFKLQVATAYIAYEKYSFSKWEAQCLMVSALVSGSSGQVSSPGQEHCVVCLGKTLYSHSASLHPGVYNGYHAERNPGINPATNQHPIQGRVEILLVASCYGNRETRLPDGPLGSYTDSS